MKALSLACLLFVIALDAHVAAAEQEDLAKRLAQAQSAQRSRNFDEAIDAYELALKSDLGSTTKTVVLINLGAAYNGKRQWDKAVPCFEAAQMLQPEQPASWYFMGDSLFALNRLEESLAAYTQAIKLLPKEAAFYSGRASLFLKMGKYELALEDCDAAVRFEPKTALHYDKRAAVYYAQSNIPAAERNYTEAIRLDPANVSALNNRGVLYLHTQQWDKAIADLSLALKLAPEHDSARCNRAQVFAGMGDWARAKSDYQEAVKLFPRDETSWMGLAILYGSCPDESQRDGKLAVEAAMKAGELSQWKSAKSLDVLGIAYAQAGEFDKAVEAADKALALLEASAPEREGIEKHRALYVKKEAFRQTGKNWGSVAAAKEADTVEGWLAAGNIALLQKDYDKAFDLLSKVLALDPEPKDRAIALGGQALVHVQRGHWDEAVQTATEAIGISPKEETFYQLRGKAWQEKGESEKAVADYSEVLRISPRDSKVQCERGRLYKMLGKPDLAEKDFTAVVERSPKSLEGWTLRALLYLNEGRWIECLRDGDRMLALKPDMPEALSMQALVLAMAPDPTIRDGKRAVAKGTRACELTQWQDWQNMSHLASAHAESGEFQAADKVLQRALALAGLPESAVNQLQDMRLQYAKGKPLYMSAKGRVGR
ncbi:tetratricopeptide repeat protein [Verrucomicrobium spinosum]|uniref:tetratricopeptide repeat protein n=1 Tax=Verrucomicrobium spinosum TaxID=2736 RepID=UPI0018DBC3F4|nr:tetratricopeptide repeat protein [Verrucomicrobium spinosum]